MRRRLIIGFILGSFVAATLPSTASADREGGMVRSCVKQANAALQGAGVSFAVDDFDNVVLGTRGADEFVPTYFANSRDLFCGFAGDDSTTVGEQLLAGDLFVGGQGANGPSELEGGVFVGGPGPDTVSLVDRDGIAVTQGGDDTIGSIGGSEAVVQGGPGDDWVSVLTSGTFLGGPGDDVVRTVAGPSATYDGGPGNDTVCTYTAGTLISVENIGGCPPE